MKYQEGVSAGIKKREEKVWSKIKEDENVGSIRKVKEKV